MAWTWPSSADSDTVGFAKLEARDGALLENFFGASAPTTPAPIAGMIWADSANSLLKSYFGGVWVAQATRPYVDATFLPLAGGTMTGPIVLAADPAAPLQAATKQYADNKFAAGPVSATADGLVRFNGTTGKIIKDGGELVIGDVPNDLITYAKLQNVSATSRILGRKTAGAGDPEEVTLSELLDFVGSAAQGDILYRSASAWVRLAAGTAQNVLQTGGAAANPSWTPKGLVNLVTAINASNVTYTTPFIPSDDTIPQSGEGNEYLTATITPKKTTNRLKIRFTGWASADAVRRIVVALFKDSDANALRASCVVTAATSNEVTLSLEHEMAAGSISPITFKIRVGVGAGSLYMLGNSAGRLFGGVGACTLTIEEIEV